MPRRKKSEAEVQPEAVTEAATEQVQRMPISELRPFKDHPFKVLDDDAMAALEQLIQRHQMEAQWTAMHKDSSISNLVGLR